MRLRVVGCIGLAMIAIHPAADAQSQPDGAVARRIILNGTVKDSSGIPIAGATIVAQGLNVEAVSNDSGLFSFGLFPSGVHRFAVRRLGYQRLLFDVDVPTTGPHALDIELSPLPTELAGVEIRRAALVDLRTTGFYDRKLRYAGATFIAPEEVEKRNASFASQVLESVPSIVVRGTVGRKRAQTRAGCELAIYLDNRFIRSGRDRRGIEWGYLDDLIDAQDVYAVEVYTHPPPEFMAPAFANQRFCGALVIWTRLYRGRR